MKSSHFIAFMMFLFSGLVTLHALMREGVSPVPRLAARIERSEEEKAQAEFRAELARHELAEFQQQVATLLPQAVKGSGEGPANYPLRQLASVVGVGREESLKIERASGQMEKAKASFREGLFEDAAESFNEIIETYPESMHVPEAEFLLAESQFQLKDFEASIVTIERMIELFPESELTGYALLRLGKIFEKQDRLEDAADVYRSVLNNFKDSKLTEQAKEQLKAVAL
jgi:TolA-binding protein